MFKPLNLDNINREKTKDSLTAPLETINFSVEILSQNDNNKNRKHWEVFETQQIFLKQID